MKQQGHLVYTGEKRNAYRILMETREGKQSFERCGRSSEVNIKMGLRTVSRKRWNWT